MDIHVEYILEGVKMLSLLTFIFCMGLFVGGIINKHPWYMVLIYLLPGLASIPGLIVFLIYILPGLASIPGLIVFLKALS